MKLSWTPPLLNVAVTLRRDEAVSDDATSVIALSQAQLPACLAMMTKRDGYFLMVRGGNQQLEAVMAEPRVHAFQSFGIIPAAGRSRRMGQPKLKMLWGAMTVIEQVVAAWRRSGVDHVVAVVRSDDSELAGLCQRAGAIVVVPEPPPPEMKDSVMAALDAITTRFHPRGDAAWLLAPADMPRLSSEVIDALLDEHSGSNQAILVPTHATPARGPSRQATAVKRGHPVLFPWPLAQDVARLNEDEGVNVLLARTPTREVAVNQPSILDDLDTVDDYRRLSAEEGHF